VIIIGVFKMNFPTEVVIMGDVEISQLLLLNKSSTL
jgi:hypothetical protein